MEFTEFIESIINPEMIQYKNDIRSRINTCIRRVEMQLVRPNAKVFIEGDFAAHIIGEMNGIFNGLTLAKILRRMIYLSVKDGYIIFKDEDKNILFSYFISTPCF